jgi:hypothetical protein
LFKFDISFYKMLWPWAFCARMPNDLLTAPLFGSDKFGWNLQMQIKIPNHFGSCVRLLVNLLIPRGRNSPKSTVASFSISKIACWATSSNYLWLLLLLAQILGWERSSICWGHLTFTSVDAQFGSRFQRLGNVQSIKIRPQP